MSLYHQPFYYEIAFDFIDIKKQIDLFEKIIKKYSKVKVRRVLDIACGPSLQLREMAKRSYDAVGLDVNSQMLKYLIQKSKEEGIKIETVQADMVNFKLKKKVDFAFIMMGSFRFKSNEELLRHLDCVSQWLARGGLYLIENLELDWPKFRQQTWKMKKDGIKVWITYRAKPKDALSQICEENLTMKVNDHGRKQKFFEKEILKIVCP